MVKSANVSSKAQLRQALELARIARLKTLHADLLPPRVKSIIDPSDGTLARAAVDEDLPVEIDEWQNVEDGNGVQLRLLIDGNWVRVGKRETIDDATTFPLTLLLPKSYMAADATLKLSYELIVDNPPKEYPDITLRVDRTPPWDRDTPDALIIADDPVTTEYLDNHPQGLEIELPVYPESKGNDKVAVFYLKELTQDPGDLPAPVLYMDVPADRKMFIPRDVIERVGNGGCYALYILVDIADNKSNLSTYKSVTVALGKLPAGLGDPEVPQAADDDTINLEDARRGVIMQIPEFENGDPTDLFDCGWGDQTFKHPVVGQLPYQLPVPNGVLKAAYGAATGPLETIVSYRVKRGEHAIPTEPDPAKSTTIKVDFSYIGPVRPEPDPTWPDPVNPGLSECQVFAKDSATPNVLLRVHNGKPATLEFVFYERAEDGQLVKFYWAGEHFANYTVKTTDTVPVKVTVPWSIINAAGNGMIPVHYTIQAEDSDNTQHSPPTEVDVKAVIVVAPKPEFQGLHENGRLVCASLVDPDDPDADRSFRLLIPDLTRFNLAPGSEINMNWVPHWGLTGDDPLPPEYAKEEIVTIDDTYPATGFIWRIQPYDDHILPLYEDVDGHRINRGRVFYSFKYQGETVSSEPFDTVVNIGTPNGTCEI